MLIKRFIPILLIIFGVAGIVVAFAADLLGFGGGPGMGTKQINLAVVGLLSLTIGLIQRYNFDWRKLFAGPVVSSPQLLRMAICLGLFAGLLESVVLLARRWMQVLVYLHQDLLWMKPLANLLVFVIVGFILLPLTKRWPDIFSLRLGGFILAFLACFAPLLQIPQLQIWAKVFLAAGLAVQISRMLVSYPTVAHGVFRRALPWMVALTGLFGMSVYAWKAIPEYRAMRNLPPAKAAAPNVLLLVLDTVRAQNLSLYGYNRSTTPRLEEFAKTGVCFEQALSTAPWTLPAHATMFTGRFTHELFNEGQTPLDRRTPLDDKYRTVAEYLSMNGYATGGFAANIDYCSSFHGLNRGFAHYEDHVPSFDLFFRASGLTNKIFWYLKYQNSVPRKSAADVNQAFLKWHSQNRDRPFFAFLNYFDAHGPYIAPQPFELKFGTQKPKFPNVLWTRTYEAQELQQLEDVYDSCIAYIDNEIGLLLDELKKENVLENTVVIVTSDHGEHFGEHGLVYHVNSLYRPLLQVPLLISFPNNIPAGKRIHDAVSLRDLPATIMDLLNLGNQSQFPGSTLSRYWDAQEESANSRTPSVFSEVLIGGEMLDWIPESWPVFKGSMKSLIEDGYHYIRYGDGSEELFDFENDADELNDLSRSVEYQEVLKRLRTKSMSFSGTH